jgi:hypothetical protein
VQHFQQNALDADEFEDSQPESEFAVPQGEEAAADGADEYSAELPTLQLIGEVRRLMAEGCRAERLVCRYLADLADRVRQRNDAMLIAYSDEFDAIRRCFGLGVREARERLRIGRALRQLPRLERAFVAGELAYSRIREVTRIATPQTELEWLQRAQNTKMRELERQVAQPLGSMPRERTPPPADERPTSRLVRISFELSSDAWTLVQRALQEVRKVTGSDLTDGEALEILARGGLARSAAAAPDELEDEAEPSDPVSGDQAGGHPPDDPASALASRPWGDCSEDLGEPGATQGGSCPTGIPHPTSVSPVSARDRQLVAIGALPEDPAARALLRLMGERHGWTTDELIEASGWSHSDVVCALVLLEIDHWVQRDFFSWLIVKTQRSRLPR